MGCISSKLLHCISGDTNSIANAKISGDLSHHTVSLTSSTYGVLNLDPFEKQNHFKSPKPSPPAAIPKSKTFSFSDPSPEIINWILVDDVEVAGIPKRTKSPAVASKVKEKFLGKENRAPCLGSDPNRVLKPLKFSENKKSCSKRCSSSPFDPDLVASFERELHFEAEQIKRMVPVRKLKEEEKEDKGGSFLLSFEKKCPPGGERAVVLYTTSLRGIRKTYEDCRLVRSMLQSYNISFSERDVSMDLGFREELRMLMGGSKEVKMPVLFVKGTLVGGAAEVLKLEEERKMEVLMEGIPKARRNCEECGGMRFVMCKECNGSCKVLDEGKKKKKCGSCNENGLVYCSSCGG